MRVQGSDVFDRKFGVWVWELLAMKFKVAGKYLALHKGANPPLMSAFVTLLYQSS